MAKKAKTVFMCQECGYESPKWMGQCICGAWNSMVEEKVVEIDEKDKRRRTSASAKGAGGGSLSASGMAEGVHAGKPSKLSQISSATSL